CSSLLSITHREAEKEGDKKRDGFKLWKWIKPYVALEWGDWEETGELSAAASMCTSGSAAIFRQARRNERSRIETSRGKMGRGKQAKMQK
ncbi:hypothetical protein KUCAC02_030494, partial [Chaenocephalus aceratus]